MDTRLTSPIVFHPKYKQMVWGGDRIARFKNTDIPMANVGESWELSALPGNESVVDLGVGVEGLTITNLIKKYGADLLGTRVYRSSDDSFPLLIKFIDARKDLSVQVHPNDALAHQRHNTLGKTEMWYILDATGDAVIHCGLSAPLTREGYCQCIKDGNIMDYVASYKSKAGQLYFVPAGTLHAIGAGNLVTEIQQTSDITYRVFDYNRLGIDGTPRQLHTELACDAIDYTYPHYIEPTAKIVDESKPAVVKSEYFTVDFIKLDYDSRHSVIHNGESFRILIVTNGSLSVEYENSTYSFSMGTTVLIPACINNFIVGGIGKALLVAC